MAERPIFVPASDEPELVQEIYLRLKWHAGFAPVQKEKNVQELHAAAAAAGYTPLLEVSSKSAEKLGRHLSAFHLKVQSRMGEILLSRRFKVARSSSVADHSPICTRWMREKRKETHACATQDRSWPLSSMAFASRSSRAPRSTTGSISA